MWVVGGYNIPGNSEFGGALINFNFKPRTTYYNYRTMNMFICNVSISDTAGNLQFYTNGCDIAGANDTILPNGDNINPGQLHYIDCVQNMRGYASNHQSAVILPLPDTQGIYYLFHESQSIVYNPTVITTDKLLYSVVDMNANNGKGQVIEKNALVMFDSLAYGEMNAVKHANGIDWWIITPQESSNQFYIFLFTNDGIVDTLIQTIGDMPPPGKEGYGQTIFSPDGTRMIRYYPYTPIMNLTFDRNTGYFTDYSTFSVNYGSDFAHQGGSAISPNGRFLYIAALLQVYQFDLWSSDIAASQVKIAVWDGFLDPIAISFLTCQLGPDCKIYILGGGDTRYYHIIHNPDEPGLACNLEQRGLVLPTPSGASIPYFPNYRLGPIDNPGLPCTATVAVSSPLGNRGLGVRAYPNPVGGQLIVALEGTMGQKHIVLRNMYGQIVKQAVVTGPSETYTLSVEDLISGIYLWEVTTASGVRLGAGKVIKQ